MKMLGFMQDQRETELKSMKICIAEQLLPFYQWIMGKTGNHFERYKNFFESKLLLGLWKDLTPLFTHLEKETTNADRCSHLQKSSGPFHDALLKPEQIIARVGIVNQVILNSVTGTKTVGG